MQARHTHTQAHRHTDTNTHKQTHGHGHTHTQTHTHTHIDWICRSVNRVQIHLGELERLFIVRQGLPDWADSASTVPRCLYELLYMSFFCFLCSDKTTLVADAASTVPAAHNICRSGDQHQPLCPASPDACCKLGRPCRPCHSSCHRRPSMPLVCATVATVVAVGPADAAARCCSCAQLLQFLRHDATRLRHRRQIPRRKSNCCRRQRVAKFAGLILLARFLSLGIPCLLLGTA